MGSIETSAFGHLPVVERDEVFALMGACKADSHPARVNLGAGVYCTEEGNPWPLRVVDQVEKSLHAQDDLHRHDYLAIEGDPEFLSLAKRLVFSPKSLEKQRQEGAQVASVQTISGTGANHIGARLLAENLPSRRVWLSDPTWANHHVIWESVGVPRSEYPYYDAATSTFDFEGMMDTLERDAQPHDILVLHACAHNPTGLDPTREQWSAIAEMCQRKGLFPFFDSAYQGFASGDPNEDAWPVNHFAQLYPPLEMCVAQSFSKNFGLYGQRTGALHVVINDPNPEVRDNVTGSLAQIIRSEYSVSPRYGATIVKKILGCPILTQKWLADLQIISGRIKDMRRALYDELCRLHTPGSWRHLVDQTGMFSYTGLNVDEVAILREKFHIYMLSSGRISVAGLNRNNVKYVAASIHSVRVNSLAISS